MRLEPNSARSMSQVARSSRVLAVGDPTPDMLDLLAKMRSGATLVTADKRCKSNTRMVAEIDGDQVNASVVKGLIRRNLIRVSSRTSRTKTWVPAEVATVENV